MSTISVTHDDQVALVRISNPPVNALSPEMIQDLRRAFVALGERRDVNAIVLASDGTRAFCAGLELKNRLGEQEGTMDAPDDVTSLLDGGRAWREAQAAVRHCPVPVIAAVEAAAVGAGFGLIGVCDIIFASERATFHLNEINVGLLGGSSKALRMLGPFKARTMFFLGEPIPAAEFYRLGVVEELTEPGQAELRALAFAHKLAAKSPIALRLAKESIVRIEKEPDMEAAYRTEQDYTNRLASFNDANEAIRSFLEKRPPKWTWS